MARRDRPIRNSLLAGSMLAAWPVLAADVTPERLLNPDKEPQNWLMNHRTYDGQRFSPLDKISKGNVKGLKLAYAVALGGGAGNEFTNATPLAEDGFLYVTDSWNVLYKIDATSGDAGRPALDAGLLAAAQAVEHYEMSRHGTLRTWAEELGLTEAATLLEETLKEEAATDAALTEIAESVVNQEGQGVAAE